MSSHFATVDSGHGDIAALSSTQLFFDFTSRGAATDMLREGWSEPEELGTWTSGAASGMRVTLPAGAGVCRLILGIVPFTCDQILKGQRLTVSCAGERLVDVFVSERIDLVCDIPASRPDPHFAMLHFSHPDAASPMSLGVSSDVRQLGLMLYSGQLQLSGTAVAAPAMPTPSPEIGAPVFAIVTQGNIGNRMMQYMVARRMEMEVPGLELANVQLPEWSLVLPQRPAVGLSAHEREEQFIDIPALAERMRVGQLNRIEYSGFGQRMENFPDVEACREMFTTDVEPVQVFGPDVLLINVRSAEIVQPVHPNYTLIPPGFYADLVRKTGLRPVFMGQTEANPYTDKLRQAFPGSEFLPSAGAMADFQTVRRAANIVPSVSTFSWLAAWLSDAAQIHLPVTGFLNPMQEPRVDLLPLDDPRYRFHLFPINHAVPPDRLGAMHEALQGGWRLVSAAMIATMRADQPRYPRGLRDYLEHFDPDFYLQRWPEFARAIEMGGFGSALDHYLRVGFPGNLECFQFDRSWYECSYPLAAYEIAQGDFIDAAHHYVSIGYRRGALPLSPAAPRMLAGQAV